MELAFYEISKEGYNDEDSLEFLKKYALVPDKKQKKSFHGTISMWKKEQAPVQKKKYRNRR